MKPVRITQEELDEKVTEELSQKRANDVIQARFLAMIAKEVYQSKDERFSSILARPKRRKSDAWKIAFAIVNKLLEEYEMKNTKEIFELENGTKITSLLYSSDKLGMKLGTNTIPAIIRNTSSKRSLSVKQRISIMQN